MHGPPDHILPPLQMSDLIRQAFSSEGPSSSLPSALPTGRKEGEETVASTSSLPSALSTGRRAEEEADALSEGAPLGFVLSSSSSAADGGGVLAGCGGGAGVAGGPGGAGVGAPLRQVAQEVQEQVQLVLAVDGSRPGSPVRVALWVGPALLASSFKSLEGEVAEDFADISSSLAAGPAGPVGAEAAAPIDGGVAAGAEREAAIAAAAAPPSPAVSVSGSTSAAAEGGPLGWAQSVERAESRASSTQVASPSPRQPPPPATEAAAAEHGASSAAGPGSLQEEGRNQQLQQRWGGALASPAGGSADLREALLMQQFLEANPSQLTYHGLLSLHEGLRDGQLAVFFR